MACKLDVLIAKGFLPIQWWEHIILLELTPIDLRAIADKVEEVAKVRGTPKSK